MGKIEQDVAVELKKNQKTSKNVVLVLFNDDINSFEFVIKSLMELCEHSTLQAEQCTLIAHSTGKCIVKEGTVKKLKPLCEAFFDRGISTTIEDKN